MAEANNSLASNAKTEPTINELQTVLSSHSTSERSDLTTTEDLYPAHFWTTERVKHAEVLWKYYPGGFFGHDRDGRPVFIQPLGRIDFKGILHSVKGEDLLNYKRDQCNFSMKDARNQEERLGVKFANCGTGILDMEGLKLSHIWLPGVNTYKKMIKMLETEYQNGCERCLIINTSSIFQTVYSFISPFINKDTKQKIKILTKQEQIIEYIAPDQLPRYYGGLAVDSTGDEKCQEFISFGGEVPHSYYVTKNIDTDNFMHASVRPGKYKRVKVEVESAGMQILYQFLTNDHDIGFSVEYQKTREGEGKVLIPMERKTSHFMMEQGCIDCHVPGVYVIVFDNSYSWLRPKEVAYHTELIITSVRDA